MADDVDAEHFVSEFIGIASKQRASSPTSLSRRLEYAHHCALESMLALGPRHWDEHLGPWFAECASVSDRYDFDYYRSRGMVDTLKSITAPFNSARSQATVTAGR